MYITGFIIPVPEDKLEAYRKWAKSSAEILKEFGCIEVVEAIGDLIPVGRQTDFRRAVKAKDDEKIVLAWKIWPDKASLDVGEARLHESGLLNVTGEIPFDPERFVLGCFEPIFTFGRGASCEGDLAPESHA